MKRLRGNIPLLIALITILASTWLMYLLVWEYGVDTGGDSPSYLARGVNFYLGNGFTLDIYDVENDQIARVPDKGRMVLWPYMYGLLMFLGVSAYDAPSVVSLLGWFFFLAGIGVLNYRLGRSPIMAALTVLLATITYSYLRLFQMAMSEVIFLPLLVWLMVTLVDLPQKATGTYSRLLTATVLLALLMLTRYTGVFVYATVWLWWVWSRVDQRQFRKLIGELAILSAAVLPLGAVVLTNIFVSGPTQAFANQFDSPNPDHTFVVGIVAVVREGLQLLLPAAHHPSSLQIRQGNDPFFFYLLPFYFMLLGIGMYLLWRSRAELKSILTPPRSPLLLFLLFYLALYTLVQPFLRFSPMDFRDSTTALALLQPWLLFRLAKASIRPPFLAGYVAFNFALVMVPLFSQGIPEWISFNPPKIYELNDRQKDVQVYSRAGVPEWLMITPPRARTLIDHHQELIDFLQPFEDQAVIVHNSSTSSHSLFYPDSLELGVPVAYQANMPCVSRHNLVIVLFDWDRWEKETSELQPEIESKCPDLSKVVLKHSIIYYPRTEP